MRGVFISLEGIEGTGKSTQARLLSEALRKKGFRTVLTAEPGGTAISMGIRELLLDKAHQGMDPITELLLYSAARRQHLVELVLPALAEGRVVITDRFSDSTRAYQGHGRGLDLSLIDNLDAVVTDGLRPHLTLLLDIDVETGLRRNREAKKVDRLELEDIAFHERVREGFLSIQRAEPGRVRIIDAEDGVAGVGEAVLRVVKEFLRKR